MYRIQGIQRKHGVEIRLFLSSFFIFIILSFNAVNQIWTIIASKQGNEEVVMWLNDLSYPFLDVMYSANPWILCVTSSAIREALLRLILPARFCKKGSTVRVVSTTSAVFTAAHSR
uniref:Serpentine receptor class gamma n=1 Tax=Steinernema glaseri TaxID=37863 RepID=A0A1I7ZK54_9BILA